MPTQKRPSPPRRPAPTREKSGPSTSQAAKPAPRTRKPAARSGAAVTPLAEWIAAGVGLALVLVTLVVIGRDAFSTAQFPPSVKVVVLEVRPVPTGFLARVRATNVGDEPAADVEVEGRLDRPGGAPEMANTTFDYLAAESSREGGLFFQSDPRSGALTVAAKGYVEP